MSYSLPIKIDLRKVFRYSPALSVRVDKDFEELGDTAKDVLYRLFNARVLETLFSNGILPAVYDEGESRKVLFISPPSIRYNVSKEPIARYPHSNYIFSVLRSAGLIEVKVYRDEEGIHEDLYFAPLGTNITKEDIFSEDVDNLSMDFIEAYLYVVLSLSSFRFEGEDRDERIFRQSTLEYKDGPYVKVSYYKRGGVENIPVRVVYIKISDDMLPHVYHKEDGTLRVGYLHKICRKNEDEGYIDVNKVIGEVEGERIVDDRFREVRVKSVDSKIIKGVYSHLTKRRFARRFYKKKLYSAKGSDRLAKIERTRSPEQYLLRDKRAIAIPKAPLVVPASLVHKFEVRQG